MAVPKEDKNEIALRAALAARLGYNAPCPECKAPAGEACRDENGKPQGAWIHTRRVSIR